MSDSNATPTGALTFESGLLWRMSLWWMVLRTSLEERFVYRGDFMLGTLMRFLPIVTQIFLWYAVFDAIGDAEGSDAKEIGGFQSAIWSLTIC